MNYLALLVGAYLAAIGGQQPGPQVNQTEWAAYKLEHGKSYADPQVDLMRSLIYAKNKLEIEQFNAELAGPKHHHHQRGLNHLSDWTDEEIQSMMGFKLPSGLGQSLSRHERPQLLRNSPAAEAFLRRILEDDSIEVPDELDWRQVPGRVSTVKNQGHCGSCWAFATVGVLEGQEAVRNRSLIRSASGSIGARQLIDLSPQNLVDCDSSELGCNGGMMGPALDFVQREGGIDSDQSYPYQAKQGECKFRRDQVAMGDAGHAVAAQQDEEQLKTLVAKFGPVAVAVYATDWVHYKGGVFQSDSCRDTQIFELNHGVLVVGYGHDKDTKLDYWLIKNSWTTKWGEQGYMRLARNVDNQCGVADVPTIPTF